MMYSNFQAKKKATQLEVKCMRAHIHFDIGDEIANSKYKR